MIPNIHAQTVSFRYPQHGYGLASVSLEVQPGDAVWIGGPSGCGKSTLARCLGGLIPHLYRGEMGGQVRIGGLRSDATPLWRLSELAGLVFQNPAAQMLTHSVEEEIIFGLENLGLSRAEIGERLDEALARFDLAALRQRSPHTLSGGEQQKLALAAIMARRPQSLVLDEPLSMLDGNAAAGLVSHLRDLTRAGVAVALCEHHTEPLRHFPALRSVQLEVPQNGPSGPADGNAPADAPLEGFPGDDVPPFTLTVADLCVTLGNHPALRHLSFAAAGGQIVAVVGRNGAGKTTLLRALAGLQPYTGAITADADRPNFALVFQNPDLQLFNPSVRAEILYRLPDPDMARYAAIVAALGLHPYQDTPPLLLSEGQKKRVALAIALMRRPRHGVLMDEPSLGQDAAHRARWLRLSRALADAGRLVIMTTHDMALAAHADRVLLLDNGAIIADGTPSVVWRDATAWAQAGLPMPDNTGDWGLGIGKECPNP